MNRSNFGKNEKKVPPCGRLIEYRPPHSPFQKLIDSQRKRYGLSGRDLADRIGVPQSALWIWLHNVNGYPHPKSCKPEHLSRLSEVLKIPEVKLKSALDASRHIYTSTEHPRPHKAFDVFGHFIEILKHDKRRHVSKDYVLNLAKNLHRGAKVTLLVLAALLAGSAISRADDLVTVRGKRYENVHVTEITPATIAFTHSTGAARLSFTEVGPDVQKKYSYDQTKANAWLAEQARKADEAVKPERARQDAQMRRANEPRLQVEEVAQAIRDGAIDPRTGRFYDAEAAQRQRAETFRWLQRYGAPRAALQQPPPGETR
jgi:transcriptional regulator with XRE-family HTH domain